MAGFQSGEIILISSVRQEAELVKCHNLEFLISSQSDIKEGISKLLDVLENFFTECVVVIHCVYIETFPTEWLWPPSRNSP